MPGTGLPPPPASFDARTLLWIGGAARGYSIGALSDGVWVGNAAGVGQVVTTTSAEFATTAGDSAFYISGQPQDNAYESNIWIVESGQAPRSFATGIWYAIALDAGTAVASRVESDGRPGGVWSVPTAGGQPTLLIPPTTIEQKHVAVTRDARRAAVGHCGFQGETSGLMQLAVDGEVTQLPAPGMPLGFDEAGALVYWRGCQQGDIARINSNREIEPLVSAPYSEARVTRDGRFLIAWILFGERSGQELQIVDLASGVTWSTEIAGSWSLSTLGDTEYAVLEGVGTTNGSDIFVAIISLREHWIGALPPLAT